MFAVVRYFLVDSDMSRISGDSQSTLWALNGRFSMIQDRIGSRTQSETSSGNRPDVEISPVGRAHPVHPESLTLH